MPDTPGRDAHAARTKVPKKIKPKTAAQKRADERAKNFAASTSIFVPPALQGGSKAPVPDRPRDTPGRDAHPKPFGPKPKPESAAESLARETRQRKARERYQLGFKDYGPTGENDLRAVPSGGLAQKKRNIISDRTLSPFEKRRAIAKAEREARTERSVVGSVGGFVGDMRDLKGELDEWAKTYSAGDLWTDVNKAAKETRRGFTPRDWGEFGKDLRFTRMPAFDWLASEKGSEAVLGKSITNVFSEGDLPKNLGEVGGLVGGIAAATPFGRLGKLGIAVKGIRNAAMVKHSEILYAKAAKATARSHTPEEIAAQRATISTETQTLVDRVNELTAKGEWTKEEAREVKAAIDEIQNLHVADQILDRAQGAKPGSFQGWSPKQTAARVQSKHNPRNKAKGIAYTNPTLLNEAGIHVAGPISNEQWVAKIMAAFPSAEERAHWGTWYDHFAPAFREAFGPLADDLMRGFAVSQANNSPTGGMLATLRVLDRLSAGETAESISHLGIGTKTLVKTIAKAVEGKDGKIDYGVAAKLSDFIDSFMQKETRTWMGDHPLGGRPAAIDVHALRDLGLVDKKLVAKLEKVHGLKFVSKEVAAKRGLKQGEFTIDGTGGASGPLYERASERYTELAEYLNSLDNGRGLDGRNNWLPSEAQALGWGATQKTHGVDPEDLMAAFAGNTRTFDVPLPGLSELSDEEARVVLDAIAPHVQRIIDATPNAFPESAIGYGFTQAGAKAGVDGTLHFDVQSSPEVAQAIANKLARTFDRYDVTAAKVGGSGSKPTIRIGGITDKETATRVYQHLLAQHPGEFVKTGFQWLEGRMYIGLKGTNITVEGQAAFHAKMGPIIEDAMRQLDIVDTKYDGVNLQTLKGKKPDVEVRTKVPGSGGGRGKRALDDSADAEARAAFDTALKRVGEGRVRAALRRATSEETGTLDVGAFFGRRGKPAAPTTVQVGGTTLPAPGQGEKLYRTIPAPISGKSEFGPTGARTVREAEEGWDDVERQITANSEDHGYDGLGHYWGDEKTATHYSTEGSITFGVEWPKGVGKYDQNGALIPGEVPGRLVSATLHTADGPVSLKIPKDYPVYASGAKKQGLLAKVREAVPTSEPVYAEQAVMRSEEKAKRLKEALPALERGGVQGMIEARKALHGALPRLDWHGFEFLDDTAREALNQHALAHPDLRDWERIRVIWAIDKAMKKGVLTPSEVKLMEKAFGENVAEKLGNRENMTIYRWLGQFALDLWNTPRSLMASYDLSAPFRQGLMSGVGHPVLFARNLKPMVKAFGKEETYLAHMDEIAGRENFPRYEKAKLAVMDVHGSGAGREEAFQSSLPERLPDKLLLGQGVKRSSRAYSLFLTKQRVDVFDKLIEMAAKRGQDIDDPKFLKALGRMVNNTTGRGQIPTKYGEDAAQFLTYFFFSPRLLASRFQVFNPEYYWKLARSGPAGPFLLRHAIKDAALTVGEIGLAATLLSQIPGVDVGTNPTSADFGKVRIGDTRIDLAGGFQPMIVLFERMRRGETTASSTGVTRKLGGYGGRNRYELATRFFEGKMAPSMGVVRDLLSDQKTFVGDPMTWKGTAANLGLPLNIQAAYDALREDGYSVAAISAMLGSIGFGTASYPDAEPGESGGGASVVSGEMSEGEGGGSYEMPEPEDTGGYEMPEPD